MLRKRLQLFSESSVRFDLVDGGYLKAAVERDKSDGCNKTTPHSQNGEEVAYSKDIHLSRQPLQQEQAPGALKGLDGWK